MTIRARLLARGRSSAIGMVLVTGLTLGASGINFVVQALLAYHFGLGGAVDSYAFSLSLPIFLAGLIGAIVSYTVVPLIVRDAGDPARRAGLCGTTLLAGAGLALLLLVLALPAALLQPLGLPPRSPIAAYPHLGVLIALGWTAAAMQVVTAVLVAQLTADNRPVSAVMLGLLPGTGATISLLLLPAHDVVQVAVGFLTGCAMAMLLGYFLQRRNITFQLGHIDARGEIADLLRKGLWAALALSCFSSFGPSDAFWAGRMPEGSLASLGYVQRLIIGVGSLIVAGPSALYVPRFAAFVQNHDGRGFSRLLTRTLAIVLGAGAVAVGILFVWSDEVVALLFRRGAFGAADVVRLGELFRAMAPGVVAMLMAVILMRALFCLPRAEIVAAALGAAWSVVYFLLSGLYHRDGATGIARSYSVSWIVIASAIAAYTFYRIDRLARTQ